MKHTAPRWRGCLAAAGVALWLGACLLLGLRPAAADALAGTITVCPGGCDYTSIETALQNSVSGTTIQVGPGEYRESIWMRGGVRIQGAGAGQSFIIWTGQAPAVIGYPSDLDRAVLDGFTIICNSPSSAIHIDGPHEKQIISNNVISNSVATWHSGGIFIVDGATPSILNNVFVNNTLTSGDGGGAIYVKDAAPLIQGNTFIGNTARNGGAIAVFNDETYTATIRNNTFTGNSAQIRGGAIYVHSASPSILNNEIYSNTAPLGAGIAVINRSNPLIQANEIAYNLAPGSDSAGGGIALVDALNPRVDRNVIRGNSAHSGGGVYVQSTAARLTNNVLAANAPGEILVNDASPHIAHNTLLGSGRADAAGIELAGSSWSTIANNIIAFEGYGIRADGVARPTIRYNDAWMNSLNYSAVTAEPSNLSVDPSLRDAAGGDVHLRSTSALVDTGNPDDAPDFDFEGDARPLDGDGDGIAIPDIGADEYAGTGPTRTRTPTPVPASPTPTPSGTRTRTATATSVGPTATRTSLHTPTPTPTASFLREEAENGTIDSPMTTGLDPAASNGRYVYSPHSNEGQVTVSLYVPGEDDYELWGRVSADGYGGDSFWVAVNGDAEVTWDLPLGEWTWAAVTHRESADVMVKQVYHLPPGWHQVVVHTREAGARLDVVELRKATVPPTPTPTVTPSVTATATVAPTRTGTATSTLVPTRTGTPTPTATPTPTRTATRVATSTQTPAPTATRTQSGTTTATATSTPAETGTPTPGFRVVLPLVVKGPVAEPGSLTPTAAAEHIRLPVFDCTEKSLILTAVPPKTRDAVAKSAETAEFIPKTSAFSACSAVRCCFFSRVVFHPLTASTEHRTFEAPLRAIAQDGGQGHALYLPIGRNAYCGWCSTPVLLTPADGSTVSTLLPAFRWDSGQDPRALRGAIEVAQDPQFTHIDIRSSCPAWARGIVESWTWLQQLDPATTYWWRVRLQCQEGAGPYSDVWSFTTAAEGLVPAVPVLLQPADESVLPSLPVTLQWSPVDGAIEYIVLWWKSGGSGTGGRWVSGTETALDNLEAGTLYQWQVLARSEYSLSASSPVRRFTTP